MSRGCGVGEARESPRRAVPPKVSERVPAYRSKDQHLRLIGFHQPNKNMPRTTDIMRDVLVAPALIPVALRHILSCGSNSEPRARLTTPIGTTKLD